MTESTRKALISRENMTSRSRYKGDHSSGLPTDRIIDEIDSSSAFNVEDVS